MVVVAVAGGSNGGSGNDDINTISTSVSTSDGVHVSSSDLERATEINLILSSSLLEWQSYADNIKGGKGTAMTSTLRPTRSSIRSNQKMNMVKNLRQQEIQILINI